MRSFRFFALFGLIFFISSAIAQDDGSKQAAANSDPIQTEKYQFNLDYTHETLSKGKGTWHTAQANITRRFANKRVIWTTLRVVDRNGIRDRDVSAGFYTPIGRKNGFTAEVGYSPTNRFTGRYTAMAEANRVFKNGWVGHLGGRFTQYRGVNAATTYVEVEKYFKNYRADYTLYITRLSNAGTAPTHRVQINKYYGEKNSSLGAGFAVGREHENLGPNVGVIRTSTVSGFSAINHWFTNKIGFNATASVTKQGDLYYRTGINVGIKFRF